MCDYSLEAYRSRPASIGESYVLHRFRSGSMGFVDKADCSTAVCIAPGVRLQLEGIDQHTQRVFGLAPTERAAFIHMDARPHRDAVQFANGRKVSLQSLNPGTCATLLDRDLEEVLSLNALAQPEPAVQSARPQGAGALLASAGASFGALMLLFFSVPG